MKSENTLELICRMLWCNISETQKLNEDNNKKILKTTIHRSQRSNNKIAEDIGKFVKSPTKIKKR